MLGGAGAIYIMVVPNLRIGGLGMSGSTSSSALVGNVRKEAQLTVGYGGVTAEYVFQIVPRLDLAIGTMLGAGGVDITLRQDAGLATTWENEWLALRTGNYQSATQIGTVRREMSGSFFVLIPSATIEYAVLGWLAVRVGASYVTMLSPSWTLDGEHDLLNVPSSVKGNGFMINAGILLGTF
jgi:hypothetical protein